MGVSVLPVVVTPETVPGYCFLASRQELDAEILTDGAFRTKVELFNKSKMDKPEVVLFAGSLVNENLITLQRLPANPKEQKKTLRKLTKEAKKIGEAINAGKLFFPEAFPEDPISPVILF